MDENKRTIEVNGIKMEIDLRQATVLENYKVGQLVKVLNKEYQNSYKVSVGLITDFFYRKTADGKEEGAIQILVLKEDYSSVNLDFQVYGEKTENFSISPFNSYEMKIPKENILSKFNNEIDKKREEILVLERKKAAFIELFKGLDAE